jgi:hypothetical protein
LRSCGLQYIRVNACGTAGLTTRDLSTFLSFVIWFGVRKHTSCNFFSPSTHLDCCSGLRRPPLTLPWPYIFFLTFRYPYTTSVRRTRFSSSLGDLGVLDWTLSNLGRAGNIDSTQPAEETGTDYIAHRCIHTSNATLAHLLIITLTSIFTKHIVPYPSYTRHP